MATTGTQPATEAPASIEDNDIQELIAPPATVSSGKSRIRRFYIHDKNKSTYICNLCRKHFKEGAKGSTGNLHNHMRLRHSVNYEEAKSAAPPPDKRARITQSTINEAVPGKRKETLTKETFMAKLLNFVVNTNQPLNIGENGSFVDLIHYISKDLETTKLPGRNKVTASVETDYTNKTRQLIDILREQGAKISLVIDCWTSSNQIAYQGIVIRFIDKDWILRTIALDLTPLSGSHTGQNISHALIDVLDRYQITDKILSITTDNASNMDTFFDCFAGLLQDRGLPFDPTNQRIRCLAHIINLLPKDRIDVFEANEVTKNAIETLRKAAHGIRASPQRREAFYRQCEEKGCPKLMPILDCRVRWNSTYDMIERGLEIQTAFTATLKSNTDLRNLALESPQWDDLKLLMKFMLPLKQATLKISMETSPNIASSTMIYQYLFQHFDEYKVIKSRNKSKYPNWLSSAATAGSTKLEKYYPDSDGKVYVIGTILHPGYKLEWYKRVNWPTDWINNCRKIITNEWEDHYKPTVILHPSTEENEQERPDFFASLYHSQMASTACAPVDQLKKYLSEPVVKTGLDGDGLLIWWKSREHEYPDLLKMARDFLSVAGSGVPVERFFSTGTDVVTDNRQSLTAEHTRMLMCLRCWQNLSLFNCI